MKVIKSFSLDTKDIREAGETRTLSVSGEKGAVFTLEIKNGANYYNFQTNLFQTAKTNLSNISIVGSVYNVSVKFPLVTAGAKYDIYLTTGIDTKHAEYKEVRFPDGSMDINSTTGSNSSLIQKVIYQTLDVTVTINGYSPNGTVTGANTTPATTVTSRDKSTNKIPFTYVFTVGGTNTLSINKQPVSNDIMVFVEPVIGDLPIDIPGEDIYPEVTTPADNTVNGGTTVNNASTGQTVTTHVASATIATVGDRVLGNDALAAAIVTVATVSGGNTFTISESISIADDLPLSFSNRRNYRWPISSTTFDVSEIKPGMRSVKSVHFANPPIVKEYLTQDTVFEGEKDEYKIDKLRIPAIETLGIKPLIVRDGTTRVVTTTTGSSTNPINIIFNEQALLVFGGITAKIYGYGTSEINRLTGYDVEFSDLAVALTKVSTTTTTAPSASATFDVTSAIGLSENISTVSGIGIDSEAVNPTITRIKDLASGTYLSSSTGYPAGEITLSAAQTLESGIGLTFPGAGTTATITGNIKINNVGNEDVTLRFDLEKFLTMNAVPAVVE